MVLMVPWAAVFFSRRFARHMAYHLSAWPRPAAPKEPVVAPSGKCTGRVLSAEWMLYITRDIAPVPLLMRYGYGLGWTQDCQQRTRIGHSGVICPALAASGVFFRNTVLVVVSFLYVHSSGVANMVRYNNCDSWFEKRPLARVSGSRSNERNETGAGF